MLSSMLAKLGTPHNRNMFSTGLNRSPAYIKTKQQNSTSVTTTIHGMQQWTRGMTTPHTLAAVVHVMVSVKPDKLACH